MKKRASSYSLIAYILLGLTLLVGACSQSPSTSVVEEPDIFTKEGFEKAIAEKGILIISKEDVIRLNPKIITPTDIKAKTTSCTNRQADTGSYIFVYEACKSVDNITVYGVSYKQVEFTQEFLDVDYINNLAIAVKTNRTSPTFAALQNQNFTAPYIVQPPGFVAIYPNADTFSFTNTNDYSSSTVTFSDTIVQNVTW